MKDALLRQLARTALWAGRVFQGNHRLEKLEIVPLLTPIDQAISLYGSAVESKPNEEFPEAMEYSFEASSYHRVVIYEWNSLIHSVTYWSALADPGRDLASVLRRYGGEHQWSALTEGYLYQRNDRSIRVWCSAVPAIGVATADYLSAEGEFRRRQRMESAD